MDDQSNIPDECSADSAVRPAEGLVSEEELSVASGVSPLALRKLEENEWLKPEGRSNGTACYSKESCEHVNSMMCSVQAQAVTDLQEAHEVALQSAPDKARRLSALAGPVGTIDPREIRTHPTFEGLLRRDEGLRKTLTVDMTLNGFYESHPVSLVTWTGLRWPVLGDGHTRVQASIDAGIQRIPFVLVAFEGEIAALQYVMNVQTKRRITRDDSTFRLIERHDDLMKRGGDRRSERRKSKPPPGGFEIRRSPSARRMADLVRFSARKVERVRTILRHGTADIQDAVKNGKMTINKAYNIVIKKPPVRRRSGEFKLTPRNMAALEKLDGDLNDLVNAAVERYVQWLLGEHGLTAENAEHAERSQRIQPLSH